MDYMNYAEMLEDLLEIQEISGRLINRLVSPLCPGGAPEKAALTAEALVRISKALEDASTEGPDCSTKAEAFIRLLEELDMDKKPFYGFK